MWWRDPTLNLEWFARFRLGSDEGRRVVTLFIATFRETQMKSTVRVLFACLIVWITFEGAAWYFSEKFIMYRRHIYPRAPLALPITKITPAPAISVHLPPPGPNAPPSYFRRMSWARCEPKLAVPHPRVGRVLRPSSEIHCEIRDEDSAVLKMVYHSDSKSRRVTPRDSRHRPGDLGSLLFLGCSYTFGNGVMDSETLPAVVARHQPQWQVYNYGLSGWGPNNLLALSEEPEFFADVSRRLQKNIGVYLFIDHHINRWIGSLDVYRMLPVWPSYLPRYEMSQGQMVHAGMMSDSILGWHGLMEVLRRSSLLAALNISFPLRLREDHIRGYIQALLQIRDNLRRTLDNFELIVMMYPGSSMAGSVSESFMANGLPVVDYSSVDLNRYLTKPAKLPDGHPSPAAYEFLGRQLVQDLKALPNRGW